MSRIASPQERLNRRLVSAESGCLEWSGCRDRKGYGQIGRGRRGEGNVFTHRLAWELANGPIPDGMYVCHSCDNPPCCNLQHLFLGTHADNMADRDSKGRVASGERSGTARLTDAQVVAIATEYVGRASRTAAGHWSSNADELAEKYGVSAKYVSQIGNGSRRAATLLRSAA